ncbi:MULTISPECIES: nucleotidyltransferase family protein [Sphingobium]|jgi:MurNAc alpha-1-phosphate uridylyltransferase|uniref:Mannose-1-phosphate guanylyltransferase n=1 Tax=Sphingobium yanoikuyae TaxID=13690 RepID=A0A0J9D382_SPHYA|nr:MULTISPECIES: nucleotidyltransferase family protein [Sphingobium]ATP19623.1 mannose-1-phosphate guanylyltransferase [Sphingobium yanoikuyae]KMW31803.1 mannose-1-phosphate guanylyltransferase [Sphingobium yanoikuyae]RSU77552.1 nucleotidyltransferase family protein [Sphingomonas sp. S-NIH.Pt3_0716]TKV44764.1 mannose-1-phosphate guanylyltransferase [Sphingobium sp. MP9-4]
MIDTAMLMAAGLGKRMRPLTATRPKPLVKVAGKALMDHALDRLAAGGIKTVVVNVHYLADTVEAHLKTRKDMDFRISDERAKLLETGGGLIHARPLLGDKPFICANSDNLWIDGPAETLGMMQRLWDSERMDALLLLVPLARANCHSGPGDFHMDANGRLTRRKIAHVAPFVFTGVQILSPRLLVDPPADVFSTNIFWNRAIAAGRLYGAVHQGLWFDVGTPQAIPVVESMIAHG